MNVEIKGNHANFIKLGECVNATLYITAINCRSLTVNDEQILASRVALLFVAHNNQNRLYIA